MTALLIILFVAGVVALLERAHRRAGAFDLAPGRTPNPGADRVRAEMDALRNEPRQATGSCTEPTARVPSTPRIAA